MTWNQILHQNISKPLGRDVLNYLPHKTSNWARHRALDTTSVCVTTITFCFLLSKSPRILLWESHPPSPQLSGGEEGDAWLGRSEPKSPGVAYVSPTTQWGLSKLPGALLPCDARSAHRGASPARYCVGRVCKREDRPGQAGVPGASVGASSPARSSAASPASPSCGLPSGSGACSACTPWSWEPSPGSCPAACRPPPPASAAGGQRLEAPQAVARPLTLSFSPFPWVGQKGDSTGFSIAVGLLSK